MSLLINPQQSVSFLLSGEVPEPTPLHSSQDFISKAIHIVQTSVQERDVDQIAVPLQALKAEYAGGTLSSATCRKLIDKIKDTDVCMQYLPTIYRHLILDLEVEVDDLSACPEEFRIAKANLDVQTNNWRVADIQKYGIKNETALIEIAKIVAQDHGEGLSLYIQKYGINNQDALVEIAKLAAKQDGEGVSKYIQNYGIKSQDALVEIAKLAAQQSGWGVSECIQNYGIKKESSLVEIAKLAAKQNGETVSKYIQNYGIKKESSLIEIAKLAAEQNGGGFCRYIEKYRIKNQEALVEIIVLALQQNVFFDLYDIFDKCNLSLKSKICIISRLVNIRPEVTRYINDYFPEALPFDLLLEYPELRIFGLVDSLGSEVEYFVEKVKITDPFTERRKALYQEILHEEDQGRKAIKKYRLHVLCSIVDFAQKTPSLLQKLIVLFTSLEQETNVQVQKQKLSLLAALLLHCRAKDVDHSAFNAQFFLLNELFAWQDPLLRLHLSHSFIEQISNPALCFKKHSSNKVSTALVQLLLAPFIVQMDAPYVELHFAAKKRNITEKDPEIRYVTFKERMQEVLNHKFFKDKMKTQSLLRSLSVLVNTPHLSQAEKTSVLRDLVFAGHLLSIKDNFKQEQCEQLLKSAETVALLIQCNQSRRLTTINSGQLHDQFSQIFASILKIDAPEDVIFNTLAKWRKPSSLLIYAGNLQSSKETREQVLPILQQFAKSVLNDTFYSDRYAASKASEHWLKVLETMPASQIEKWKKGNAYVENGFDIVDTDHPCDLLLSGTEVGSCQKVDRDINNSKCLVAYLVDPKIRMMAIKNKEGATIARCMMRLLWDSTAKEFVLFQEEIYPAGIHTSFREMLDHACKKRAEELGLPLLVKGESPLESAATTLQAFKGKAPFEYVDALGLGGNGVQTDAGYEISGCKYIYNPKQKNQF